jgi:hypothetical protein
VLWSQVHGRLIVLNPGHAILGHKCTTNWGKLGALVRSTVGTLKITWWLKSTKTTNLTTESANLVAKLSVLQAKSVGLTTGSLSLLRYHGSGLALLIEVTQQSLMFRNSYELSAWLSV